MNDQLSDSPTSGQAKLPRVLGPVAAYCVVVGSVIGSGIFLVPSDVAKAVPSFGTIVFVWIIGGVFSTFRALTLAELGAMLPQAGGPYVYLREAYGRLIAFLFGWSEFLINRTGSMATLAAAFANSFAQIAGAGGDHARNLAGRRGCLGDRRRHDRERARHGVGRQVASGGDGRQGRRRVGSHSLAVPDGTRRSDKAATDLAHHVRFHACIGHDGRDGRCALGLRRLDESDAPGRGSARPRPQHSAPSAWGWPRSSGFTSPRPSPITLF